MPRKHLGLHSVGRLPILALLLVVMTNAPVKAQTVREWIDPLGGNYNDISNWSGFNVPDTISETADFSILFGTYDVTLDSGVTTVVSDLLINAFDEVTFNASGLATAIYEMDDDALITQFGSLILLQAPGLGDVTLNVGDLLSITGEGTVDVLQGSDVTAAFLNIGSNGGGTLLVDGAGSSVTTGAGFSTWGSNGSMADVTFRNGAMGDLGGLELSFFASAGTTSIFRVESGATVTTDNLNIVRLSNFTNSGTITVDGVGSSLTQNGGSTLVVGNNSVGTATINVQNSGTFTTGTGLTTVGATGTVNVNTGGTFNLLGNLDLFGTLNLVGGTLSAVDPDLTGGIFNFPFGTLELNSDHTLDVQQIADFKISSLGAGKTLRVNGVATLLTPLTLVGGTFTTESLVNPFLLDFQSGTFELTGDDLVIGPAGLFGAPLTVATEQAIKVTNTTTVESGATLVIESGGTFMAGTLANNGLVTGDGTLGGNFTNSLTGEVRVSSGQSLDFIGATNTNAGAINVLGGSVVFDSALANLADGNILGRGTLIFGGAGLTNTGDLALSNGQTDVFGDVDNQTTGRVMISGNADVTFWDDVADSGSLFTVSTGSSATFFGTAGFGISGGGEVFFEADVTPGSSPGLENFGGDVYFGPVASLEIEIGGLSAGSEFDQINVTSLVSLDGTLDVTFIDEFMPTAGDTFEIITAASVLGVFDTINLPSLPGDLLWFVNYDATSVELVSTFAADFDEDGDVDNDDLAAWEGGFGLSPATHMTGDANANALASGFDFLTWQRQFGSGGGTPLAAATTIPEPSSLLLAVLGLLALSTQKSLRTHRPARRSYSTSNQRMYSK